MYDKGPSGEGLYTELVRQARFEAGLLERVDDDRVHCIIDSILREKSRLIYIPIQDQVILKQRIFNALRRLDILQPLVDDPTITEIMINGRDEIFVERMGRVSRLDYAFESREQLENVIQMIVSKVNRVVNESTPICDARLEDGSRIHVVLPPVALKGPTLTIRKFPEKPLTMKDLIAWGSIDEGAAVFLETLVKARYNLFICGGTGSGKTTFLNVLSNAIPDDERIITIEDSAELQITGVPNLVSLETRNDNVEGKGAVTVRDLIKASLRMRPDRIVVGEVRGEEALDMLQAMNTGHDGSLSTGHANSTKDMLSRLETMVLSGSTMPLEAVRQQIASAIDVMVHLARFRDKTRKVVQIIEVLGYEEGRILLNPLYEYVENEDSSDDCVKGSLTAVGTKLVGQEKLEQANMAHKAVIE